MPNPLAKMVSRMPAACPTNANRASFRIPSTSQSGPPIIIATVNPQKAVPAIQPICSLVSENWVSRPPMMSPRIAKLIAVTTNAMQLAINKR